MDSHTHVVFAAHLLRACGGPSAYRIVSLFPQIDRSPPTLHRLYAHTVFRARELTAAGLQLLAQSATTQDAAVIPNRFAVRRFGEERERMLSYLGEPVWEQASDSRSAEFETALMAYVTHLYLDTYNQPTQPFAPSSVYCSGQWSLWEQLGDFRLALYTTPAIDALRSELFARPLWQRTPRFTASTLIHAMLLRMCHFGLERLPEDLIEPALRSLGVGPASDIELLPVLEFLKAFERDLLELHIKHLGGFRAADPTVERAVTLPDVHYGTV